MNTEIPASVRRALANLEPDDQVLPMVELVFEVDDPAVTSAVVRKLLAEIRAQRGGRSPDHGD